MGAPLQGCPLLFIAIELTMALPIWRPGARVSLGWMSQFSFEPERSSLTQRAHHARAVHIAGAWQLWHDLTAGKHAQGRQYVEMCSSLMQEWHILNNLAGLTLRGAGCLTLWNGLEPKFSDLLGCTRRSEAIDVRELCPPPVLAAPKLGTRFAEFWQ